MDAIDRELVGLAQQCAGLLGRRQLLEAGLRPKQISRRVGSGRLHVVHRSVYSLVDGPLSAEQLAIAACLAVPDGVLSHHTAAALHGLRGVPQRRLEMTVPPGRHPNVSGVLFRRSNRLPEHHLQLWSNGIRVSTVARTIYDLGGIMDEAAHRNLLTDALNRSIVTLEELAEVGVELSSRGRPGSAAHRRLAHVEPPSIIGVMSEGELLLGDALRDVGLTIVRQHPIALPSGRPVKLDLALPDLRIDIEVDHPHWHATPDGLQRDHARDNELALLAWERLRFTTADVTTRLASCVAIVRAIERRRRLAAAA
jgi:very-short-patch-repair endonuclease